MLKKCGKYPILKISKISDIFELETIGYISDIYITDIYIADIYRANPDSTRPTLFKSTVMRKMRKKRNVAEKRLTSALAFIHEPAYISTN